MLVTSDNYSNRVRFSAQLSSNAIPMNETHIELVRRAVPLWYANVAWTKELLIQAFDLADAQDILKSSHRRTQCIPNTCWSFRVHGAGIDIYRTPNVGGIDFDFGKPSPDE